MTITVATLWTWVQWARLLAPAIGLGLSALVAAQSREYYYRNWRGETGTGQRTARSYVETDVRDALLQALLVVYALYGLNSPVPRAVANQNVRNVGAAVALVISLLVSGFQMRGLITRNAVRRILADRSGHPDESLAAYVQSVESRLLDLTAAFTGLRTDFRIVKTTVERELGPSAQEPPKTSALTIDDLDPPPPRPAAPEPTAHDANLLHDPRYVRPEREEPQS